MLNTDEPEAHKFYANNIPKLEVPGMKIGKQQEGNVSRVRHQSGSA